MRQEIKLLQPLLGESVEAARKAQDRIGALGARVIGDKVRYIPAIEAKYQADWAEPASYREHSAVLYLHGGGYTAGTLEYARGFGGILAELNELRTLCVGYRLAPENPFPAALDDALDAYLYMLKSYSPSKIAFVGESAGGGLCFALCHKLISLSLPLPACITAISPWVDLTLTLDAVSRNSELDPTLTASSLCVQAALYARGDLKNPYVSPLYGNFTNFPPSLIFAGSHEILEDDARAIHDKLILAKRESTLHIEDGAWHAYVLYGIYEARQALERVKLFIGEKTNEG